MYDLWNSLHTFGNHIGLFASLFDMFISVHISEQEPLSSVLLNECMCVCIDVCLLVIPVLSFLLAYFDAELK